MRAQRWIKGAAGGCLAGALVVVATATVTDWAGGTEVLMVAQKPADVVELERALWQPGEPVAPIYGTPAEQPNRVLWPDPEKLVRPPEDPELTLLLVDRSQGDQPLQAKTVWFFAWRGAAGLALLGLAGAGLALGLSLGSRRTQNPLATTQSPKEAPAPKPH